MFYLLCYSLLSHFKNLSRFHCIFFVLLLLLVVTFIVLSCCKVIPSSHKISLMLYIMLSVAFALSMSSVTACLKKFNLAFGFLYISGLCALISFLVCKYKEKCSKVVISTLVAGIPIPLIVLAIPVKRLEQLIVMPVFTLVYYLIFSLASLGRGKNNMQYYSCSKSLAIISPILIAMFIWFVIAIASAMSGLFSQLFKTLLKFKYLQ